MQLHNNIDKFICYFSHFDRTEYKFNRTINITKIIIIT